MTDREKRICKNCGHTIRKQRGGDLRDRGKWIHGDDHNDGKCLCNKPRLREEKG